MKIFSIILILFAAFHRVFAQEGSFRDPIKGKFFQLFSTTKPTEQGKGLRFSLSYDIVKVYAGEMKLESLKGGSLPCLPDRQAVTGTARNIDWFLALFDMESCPY